MYAIWTLPKSTDNILQNISEFNITDVIDTSAETHMNQGTLTLWNNVQSANHDSKIRTSSDAFYRAFQQIDKILIRVSFI